MGEDWLSSSHTGDVAGEEVDAVAVEVAASAVVVLGGARVGVPGETLGIAERDSGVESVGDRGVAERVEAEVWVSRSVADAGVHPVAVALVDRLARCDGLGNLEEADQLATVQALGACLVLVDLRQARVDRRVGRVGPSMWANRKNPRTPCLIVLTEDGIRPLRSGRVRRSRPL